MRPAILVTSTCGDAGGEISIRGEGGIVKTGAAGGHLLQQALALDLLKKDTAEGHL